MINGKNKRGKKMYRQKQKTILTFNVKTNCEIA